MSEFEKASINLQKQQLEIQQKAVESKKQDALAVAAPLKKLILDKCSMLDNELELTPVLNLKGGDEQLISRTMHKLARWKS